jgi:hypothetical protein
MEKRRWLLLGEPMSEASTEKNFGPDHVCWAVRASVLSFEILLVEKTMEVDGFIVRSSLAMRDQCRKT